jgi:hypothetical protein
MRLGGGVWDGGEWVDVRSDPFMGCLCGVVAFVCGYTAIGLQ